MVTDEQNLHGCSDEEEEDVEHRNGEDSSLESAGEVQVGSVGDILI